MARTNIPITSLTANAEVAEPAGTAVDATNGHEVSGVPLEELVLQIKNGATAMNVTILAGDNPPAGAAGQGNVVVAAGANETSFVGPFTSARFMQVNDGTDPTGLYIDIDDDTDGTIVALHVPRDA